MPNNKSRLNIDWRKMKKYKKKTKENKLEFNTYCIFTEKKQDVEETIGLIFRDYIESLKIKDK